VLALRVAGGLFGVALLVATLVRYRGRKISRLNLLITTAVSLLVILLAVVPNLFDPLLNLFNFQRGGGGRLLGVALLGLVVLLLLILRTMSESDTVARDLRLLIEVLGQQSFDPEQARHLPPGDRIVVVMPAYNEEENVGQVIRDMPPEIEGIPVVPLVVDDSSEDETSRVARDAGAMVARLPIRRGGGLALRVGYEIALKLDARIVASMDSDGQHLPEELKVVVGPILRDEADMVQGSRMLGVFEKESRVRHLGVLFFSKLVTLMTGLKVTDVSSGYRAARLETLRKLVLTQDQFWTSEVLIEGLRQRARIVEVPITIRARTSGESKKPKSLRYGWNFTKAIVQTWLR
jgi:hypothetical protein